LFVMRSEYQVPLEETGLPLLRSGENLFQVGRFTFPAASAYIKGSGLDLQPDAVDRLLASAAELDETPLGWMFSYETAVPLRCPSVLTMPLTPWMSRSTLVAPHRVG
jgi:hypothetical protein